MGFIISSILVDACTVAGELSDGPGHNNTSPPGQAQAQHPTSEQSAAFEGKRGALLVVVSHETGKPLATYQLDVVPRFDGLIAANGRLYMATLGGALLCLSDPEGQSLPPAKPWGQDR